MPWDVNSDATLRRDIERWGTELDVLDDAGLGNTAPARTIRDWIDWAKDKICK